MADLSPFWECVCPRAGHACVSATRAAGAGGSVTRHQAERAERTGRGGAESSAEQPLPAVAVDPGPRPRLYGQKLAAAAYSGAGALGKRGAGTAPAAPLRRWVRLSKRISQSPSPLPHSCPLLKPLLA